jgi:phytoene dehydrogenase-like protein
MTQPPRLDVAVIGAGFGGLGAALRLTERGARVALFEALRYPGGCASTFSRGGYRFESGATLSSGFAPGQLFDRWMRRYDLPLTLDWLDPVAQLRAPGLRLDIPPQADALLARLCALPGAPQPQLRAFFAEQRQVADTLWALFDDPDLLPPFGAAALLAHIQRAPRYLPLLRHLGRPLSAALRRHGLDAWAPLQIYLNAACQITVQASADEAEAPFAMSTLDYWFRGTAHVRGGLGALADALLGAIRANGAQVSMPDEVRRLEPLPDGAWRLHTRRHTVEARQVVANLLPQALQALLPPDARSRWLDALSDQVAQGWGAVMLYRALRAPLDAPDKPLHIELVQDPAVAFTEGNHLFCSISGPLDPDRAPDGLRTMTASTHVPLQHLLSLPDSDQAALIAQIQQTMRLGLHTLAPEWTDTRHELTASPRTFARFTRRPGGYVGGIPRRAGLHNYRHLLPTPALPHLYLVGDSVFPGQSTLATATGGVKLAEHLT